MELKLCVIAYYLYRWLKRFQGTSTDGRSCLIGQIPAKSFLPQVSSRDIIAGLTAPKRMQKGTPAPIPIAAPVDRLVVGNMKTRPTKVFPNSSIKDKEDCRIDVSRVLIKVLVEAIKVAITKFSYLV